MMGSLPCSSLVGVPYTIYVGSFVCQDGLLEVARRPTLHRVTRSPSLVMPERLLACVPNLGGFMPGDSPTIPDEVASLSRMPAASL